MDRRTFVSCLALSPVLAASPALAGWDEGVAAIFSANPGGTASVTRTRSGFLLEVSGLRFNIGMPPNLSAWRSDLSDMRSFEVTIGTSSLTAQIDGLRRARVRKDSGEAHVVSVQGASGLRALADTPEGRFAVMVGIAAVAFGREALGRGGQGVVMSGGSTMQFLLEVTG